MRKGLCVAILVALWVLPAAGMAAELLGRLFFSPAQRSALDASKYLAATPARAAVPAPRSVHLSGVVTRSDAESTVWINGTAYHDASPDGVHVKTDQAAPASTAIRVRGKTAATRIKVGQELDLNSGRIREGSTGQPAATENAAAPAESTPSLPVRAKGSRADEAPPVREGKNGQ